MWIAAHPQSVSQNLADALSRQQMPYCGIALRRDVWTGIVANMQTVIV